MAYPIQRYRSKRRLIRIASKPPPTPYRGRNWIDLAAAPQHLVSVLRSFFIMALFIGVIFALSAPVIAAPVEPCAQMPTAAPAAMAGMADCCPGDQNSRESRDPCKDMAAACALMACCSTIVPSSNVLLQLHLDVATDRTWFRTAAPTLYGRSIPPEPYPPSRLG